MKSKITLMAVLCAGLLAGNTALANNHTVSIGYAQSKVEDFKNLRGVNVQYRYEWDSPLSVIGSFSYLKGDESFSEREDFYGDISGYDGKTNVKYYSLMAGPAYRLNDYVSLYALIGAAHTKVDENVTYLDGWSEKYSENKTSLSWGAGIVVNPVSNLSVSVGYEGTRVKYSEDVAINGFNIGIGYRF